MEAPRVVEAQRIGAMPEPILLRSFEDWRGCEPPELLYYADLIEIARPYWYQERRRERLRHRSRHTVARRSAGRRDER